MNARSGQLPDWPDRRCSRFMFGLAINRYALSKQGALKILGIALRRIQTTDPGELIPSSCDTLNEHLTIAQRLRVFDGLVEVLVADGRVHEGEECFLDYVASRLCLLKTLEKRFTNDKLER